MDINRVVGCTPLEQEYEEKRKMYEENLLSAKEWSAFYEHLLEKIMVENYRKYLTNVEQKR